MLENSFFLNLFSITLKDEKHDNKFPMFTYHKQTVFCTSPTYIWYNCACHIKAKYAGANTNCRETIANGATTMCQTCDTLLG